MVNLILFGAIADVLGVGLGLLFNKLVIKNFPETGRKASYVKTVIVFLLIAVVIFAALYGKSIVDDSVKSFSGKVEQDIKKNYSNLDIVKNGIDLTAASKDSSKLNNTVNDLTRVLKPSDFGVPAFIWNTVLSNVKKELQKIIISFNKSGGASNPFVDERNYLTVSSLINGLQITILKVVKVTVIVIVSICVILLAIYILVSLSKASKEKKRAESKSAP